MSSNHLKIIAWFLLLVFIGCTKDDEPVKKETPEIPVETQDATYQAAQLDITTQQAVSVSSKETYVNCSVTITSTKKEWNYTGTGRIKGRGNSSWLWYPKKPYRIKLDKKAAILGLKADKDWVLLADYRDPTHLMNAFVFTVGQGLNFPCINHVRYAEFYLNGHYIGLYLLTEQIEQGENRVSIDQAEGILLSLDADDGPELSPNAKDNFWSSVYQLPVCVKNPDIASTAQLTSIRSNFAVLENAISQADYETIDRMLNLNSFIDYLLIQELVYNVEVAAPRSIYLYKDKAGKWTMGPLWDFDAGFDFDWSTMYTGHNYFNSYTELVLGTAPLDHTGGYIVPSFFTDLFRNKRFVNEYKARWLEIKDSIMGEYWTTTLRYAKGTDEAMKRNASQWPIGKDYTNEISSMQRWLTNRVDYLTTVISNYPSGTK
ncbi:MAG: CotH kinase family protein [Bacteroidota bacterium]|nr:CotH kinase family protein [Bacteroidota bacterium]